MKTWLKRCAGFSADSLGMLRRQQGQHALILMLHRVLPQQHYDQLSFQKMLAVSEAGLETLIRYLQQHYTLIQLDDYLALSADQLGTERFVCLTFDDGWQDNYHYALPILQALGAPASVYLSTGFIGARQHFWWQAVGDALAQGEQNPGLQQAISGILRQAIPAHMPARDTDQIIAALKTCAPAVRADCVRALTELLDDYPAHAMSWQQAQGMADSGWIRFGTHTVSHCLLTQLDTASAQHEISACREELLRHPGLPFNHILCYPNGDCNAEVIAQTQAIGYRAALATQPGYASSAAAQRFCLPRINVTEETALNPSLFNYRLLKIAEHTGYPG